MKLSPHFDSAEFACKCGCGLSDPDPMLIFALESLRVHLGKPVIVTSGCRCAAHNTAEGGALHSQHVFGSAADVRVKGMTARGLYAEAAIISAFHGFGVDDERGFLHVDVRDAPAKWCYRSGKQVLWYETPEVENA